MGRMRLWRLYGAGLGGNRGNHRGWDRLIIFKAMPLTVHVHVGVRWGLGELLIHRRGELCNVGVGHISSSFQSNRSWGGVVGDA